MCLTLIVEDNASFRQALRDLLQTSFPSMLIHEAGDGLEALRKVDTSKPDLIFMDIKLPGSNGLEITKRIRQKDTSIVVIILTSYDLPEYREAAFRSGANYFFTKGLTGSEDIVSLVQSLLKGERTESS